MVQNEVANRKFRCSAFGQFFQDFHSIIEIFKRNLRHKIRHWHDCPTADSRRIHRQVGNVDVFIPMQPIQQNHGSLSKVFWQTSDKGLGDLV